MPYLLLLRHGKSEWNELGLWTGHTDIDLAETGRVEARQAAEAIRDIPIHAIHVSDLRRAEQTMDEVKQALGLTDLPHTAHAALKERHYGAYTGKNKWQIKEEIGEEKFQQLRRGWDVPIPEGETLKDVYERVAKYFNEVIRPDLQAGKNTLIVAHGNSLRALAKHVEDLSEAEVCALEIGTGEVHFYAITDDGKMDRKEIRAVNTEKKKV